MRPSDFIEEVLALNVTCIHGVPETVTRDALKVIDWSDVKSYSSFATWKTSTVNDSLYVS